MSPHWQKQLQRFEDPASSALLKGIGRGIEKESLRVTPEGTLAQTPHPRALGSALTHGAITTDYSEALLEFITPVSNSIDASLEELSDIHAFTCQHLGDEILWATSMPCVVTEDEGIPVAQYGSSNVARMKTVYRYGLGHRYGRKMQTIAGIHYNFSLPMPLWEQRWRDAGEPGKLKDFITEGYLGMIRNFRRHVWLLVYLFGASPAVCKSFLKGNDRHSLVPFGDDTHSLHLPYATSLRMGDLGYTSVAQRNMTICYNSLDSYVDTLRQAIMTPHPDYAAIPHGEHGDYQQLNASLLQIENEFYSPIRPKRVAASGETPLAALRRGGIEYIEVRCVDINPFAPVGIDAAQVRFLDTFLLHCWLNHSPECNEDEQRRMAANLLAVVNRGREPGLELEREQGPQLLPAWGNALLDEMAPIAALLDRVHDTQGYSEALAAQRAKLADPELTPSARVLRTMREQDLTFFRFAMGQSERWAREFREHPLPAAAAQRLADESERSLTAQDAVEAADDISFEEYLARFYAQYEAV